MLMLVIFFYKQNYLKQYYRIMYCYNQFLFQKTFFILKKYILVRK